jgi:hypothetical protein
MDEKGDYNFQFSKTVLPLPYHAMKYYTAPLSPLDQDKAYQLHPSDWQEFHTRYVAQEPFGSACGGDNASLLLTLNATSG